MLRVLLVWLALGTMAASAVSHSFVGKRVKLRFDEHEVRLTNIEVCDNLGVFRSMASQAEWEIVTDAWTDKAQFLVPEKLLRREHGNCRFVYSVSGRPGWELALDFRQEAGILRHQITIVNPEKEVVSLDVRLVFSDLYIGYRKAFNTNSMYLNGYETLRYRADYIGEFPMTSIIDERLNIGLTLNGTFGIMRPRFSIDYTKKMPTRSLVWRNRYIGAGDGQTARVSLDFWGHSGDWRPGMGEIYQAYRDYFTTGNEAIRSHEGNFICDWYFLGYTEEKFKAWKRMNLRNCEIIFYNPNYGIYAPEVSDRENWTILMLEKERFEDFHNRRDRQTSYAAIKKVISDMRKHDVGSFIYFNYIDLSKTFPSLCKRFKDQIFINAETSMQRGKLGQVAWGNDKLHIMHMEPGEPWARHCENQARKLLERLPGCDGYFIDMASGYGVYDANHADGVTVINNKKAYYDAIGIERIQRHLATTLWRPTGKGIWANGAKFPEISRYCDALIAEIPGWTRPERDPGVPQISFLCLHKPFAYMLAAWRKDNKPPNPNHIERHLKYALLYGGYTDAMIPMRGPKRVWAFERYYPFFAALEGKCWVFDPHPLALPKGLQGNIFKLRDGSYTVFVLDPNHGLLDDDQHIWKNATVKVRIHDLEAVRRVEFVSVEQSDTRVSIPFSIKDGSLQVALPKFSSAGMLRLFSEN